MGKSKISQELIENAKLWSCKELGSSQTLEVYGINVQCPNMIQALISKS